MRVGIPVSPGVAVGTAYCVYEIFVDSRASVVGEGRALDELARFERAREQTADDLHALIEKVSTQVGHDEAAVFRVQETILHDPALLNKVRGWVVKERQSAQAALQHVLQEYTALFSRTQDEYLRERLADLRDVIIRISGYLSPVLDPESETAMGPLILVADELLPSNVVQLGDRQFVGIVTQTGGRTSHAAILARSRGIPAVSGIPGMLRLVKNGDVVVVDGRNGHVLVNPDPETESAYRKLQREFVDLKDHLAENRDAPAVTSDGTAIELLANINSVHDAEVALRMGAAGIGLFRTEYLFLTHPGVPDEEEQYHAYRQIIEASPNRRVTIRTLDLGGDKTIPYLGHSREANPFLGWRSIRLSFEHPQFFLTQIRAVLRAAAKAQTDQQVRLMFPMITTREEMRKVKAMVLRARRQLERLGQPQGEVSIGLMLEVPAASVCIDQLLELVDFVSIGSNDLVQYLMAADRDNPKVNHLCQPLSPAVARVLCDVIRTCNEFGKPVTLCGEMAGSPRGFLLLLGLGLRSFSMSPAFIPTIKDLTSHLSVTEARRIADEALRFKTSGQIIRYLGEQISRLAPNLGLLDSA